MVEKLALNSLSTALGDIPAVSMTIAHSLKTGDLCCIVLCDTTSHFRGLFIVPSTRCTCVITMQFNQLLDMPHLSSGWIILVQDKCLLTGMSTDLYIEFERNKLFMHMGFLWDLLFQLMKHGANTLLRIYIFVQYTSESR